MKSNRGVDNWLTESGLLPVVGKPGRISEEEESNLNHCRFLLLVMHRMTLDTSADGASGRFSVMHLMWIAEHMNDPDAIVEYVRKNFRRDGTSRDLPAL